MVYGLLQLNQGSFMRARRLVAVLSALAAAVVVPVVSAPVASADPCPSLYVVAIPGTWEPSGTRPGAGMLAPVTNGLPGSVRTRLRHLLGDGLPLGVQRLRQVEAAGCRQCPRHDRRYGRLVR